MKIFDFKDKKSGILLVSVILVTAFLLSACTEKAIREDVGDNEKQNESQTAPETDTGGEKGFVGKLKDAVLSGKTMKCTWKKDDSMGETYVRGEDVYGEFTSAGKTGYMIMKDDCMYSWSDDMDQGIKMCSMETEMDDVDDETDINIDFDQMKNSGLPDDINYECKPVMFGDDRFDLPTDKEFMDLNTLMGGEGN